MTKYSIDAVIVTYNPDIRLLLDNVKAIINQVDKIFIVDNGSDNLDQWNSLINSSNVSVFPLLENKGIAYAQNFGIKKSKEQSSDWVLTLDQDTILPTSYVVEIMRNHFPSKVGIISGRFIDRSWKEINSIYNEKPNIEEVNEIISSGNIVNICAWKNVGGFDENLFIDYVDFDFDYKLHRQEYGIYRVNNVVFEHEIGNGIPESMIKTFLGLKKKHVFDHSAYRLYYINRNRIIVRAKFPEYGSPYKMIVRELINLKEILLFEKPKVNKLRFSIKGIFAGIYYLFSGRYLDETN
ncbi:glycosyltransferase family 2 protein [Leuconostoc citreum]|uniref:Glycosyl transferase family 2 n=1 Tax=Leuconostoc citreum TaxID=33964 RepID=A0A5A5U313_LEUCI|nr:glycosyltransferase family 2 protein [Leuconostoc citreum]MCT3067591.1 glycosyltransferase family 2 protein [Leuconostoc citreum]TDG66631.1 hypothetical protein C5L21_001657 [Leuconostoc citreum]GDZ84749.1 glycosyl transferase family 2 [Leuconostoc citreum]GDZ85221.1 glycosyl transferase family 2 [Leuconostoc citreum]